MHNMYLGHSQSCLQLLTTGFLKEENPAPPLGCVMDQLVSVTDCYPFFHTYIDKFAHHWMYFHLKVKIKIYLSICLPSLVWIEIIGFCLSQGAISSHEWPKVTSGWKGTEWEVKSLNCLHQPVEVNNELFLISSFSLQLRKPCQN